MKKLYFNGNFPLCQGNINSLVEEDGKITFIGNSDEINLSENEYHKFDLGGRTVLPAFIDSHSHILQQAISMRCATLTGCKSFDDIISVLKDFKEKSHIPDGAWIVGVAYDHESMIEKRHPDRNVLDKVSTVNPVLISHASGHMGCINSLGLKIAGLDENSSISGGVLGKFPDGSLSGYLEEKAFINTSEIIPPPDDDEIFRLLDKAQKMYASYGITTAQEGFMKEYEFEMLKKASQQNKLYTDIVGYVDIKDNSHVIKENPEYLTYRNGFRLGGYKLFLDGSPQGRTAWVTKPYEKADNQPADYCGYPIYSDDEAKAYVSKAQSEHIQLITHCNGDAAIDQLLNAHSSPSEERNVIIHAQLMRRDQLQRAKNLNLIPDFFVAHTYYWGDVHIKNFGKHRADFISPAKSAELLGLPFTFHQDTPVLPPDMINTIWCAANRLTKSGIPLSEEERISVYSAIKAVTINSAYQYHEEKSKGSLEVGKNADMVILDRDILKTSPETIEEVKILATIKNGNPIFQIK